MFTRGRLAAIFLSVLFLTIMGSAAEAAIMARKTPDGKWAYVPLADGFDFPVGKPDGEGYYKARGLRLRTPRHLGEDWNGVGGGNSDLGDPVYTIGHGLVTYAADAKGRWGNVVIVRHAFRDPKSGKVLCCQTLYAHLDRIDVQLGQLVRRGDQIGTIGTNRGMFPAHLHAELHFNVLVNCGHQGIPKTAANYGDLSRFIKNLRRLTPEKKYIKMPIGCFLPYKDTEGL
ncbi:MAG TPA: M23 family metallopeptidase [Candidatus Akkermansia intestinigallinarum]|uniref:M23 family metallopeptidase n=1 Tax=Candidatus Akkermansia intestinigallinarum TaxID=2838431 RepID=A0A9D1VA59_9BACT|nr:M23 family metallopeptidase [Candidatus Akkermansia intestinigallinarum]